MRERVIVVSFSVCLSVCLSVKIKLPPLQPLKYAPNGRRPYFIGFKMCRFFDKGCCLGEKASQTWPIEIVLCVTLPLKVDVLSRWLVGNACACRSSPLWTVVFRNLWDGYSSQFSVNNIWELTPIQHFWLKIYCNMLSSLVLVCSSYFLAIHFLSPKRGSVQEAWLSTFKALYYL